MATLQTSRQSSAFTARSRLQQVTREYPPETYTHPTQAHAPAERMERVEESIPATLNVPGGIREDGALAGTYRYRLSEVDQHQILLNAVGIYAGWYLVSVQRRAENDQLVAHLVRESDQGDPAAAIREGRTLQIMIDITGDMKVQYGRRRRQGRLARWLTRLFDLGD